MLDILRDKKVIFFDVGYTLDAPASGDWMFTNRFLELAGDKLKQRTETEIQQAREAGLRFLSQNHVIQTVEAEIRNFFDYYSMISDRLDLGLSEKERDQIARDRACNMKNYIPYPGIVEVLSTLSTTHKLGIISDTWPSILPQLEYIGVSQYLSFCTFSCFVGVFKPDKRIYLDALNKCGVSAEETVFIDDAILTNETYMGDKILQKTYTLDFLHKTPIKNQGQVPMYHIEQDHEAIIPPETFKRVQDEILRRKNRPLQGQTIFSGKIFCGCCGATFGPKVWHSNKNVRFYTEKCGFQIVGTEKDGNVELVRFLMER